MSITETNFFTENPIKEFIGSGFEKYRPHWQWKRNINNASLYFISEGKLKFQLDTHDFTAQRGDVVFLKKSDIAIIKNEEDTYSNLYYIAFNYDEKTNLCISTILKNTSYEIFFKEILDAHRSMAPLSSLKISHTFQKLLYSLITDNLHSNRDYQLTSRIKAAAEYININYYKNISIECLCKITGYSPAHLRRLFIKTYGTSPQNYILDKRIDMAKELLGDIPEKTIDEIADLLGMSSTSYFCKLFKTKTGLSPTNFRNKFNVIKN